MRSIMMKKNSQLEGKLHKQIESLENDKRNYLQNSYREMGLIKTEIRNIIATLAVAKKYNSIEAKGNKSNLPMSSHHDGTTPNGRIHYKNCTAVIGRSNDYRISKHSHGNRIKFPGNCTSLFSHHKFIEEEINRVERLLKDNTYQKRKLKSLAKNIIIFDDIIQSNLTFNEVMDQYRSTMADR